VTNGQDVGAKRYKKESSKAKWDSGGGRGQVSGEVGGPVGAKKIPTPDSLSAERRWAGKRILKKGSSLHRGTVLSIRMRKRKGESKKRLHAKEEGPTLKAV